MIALRSKAGWSWGCVSVADSQGRTIFVADAHRGDGKPSLHLTLWRYHGRHGATFWPHSRSQHQTAHTAIRGGAAVKYLLLILELPIRFVRALIGFTFFGWIGWAGLILLLLRLVGVIHWPWWAAALPLEYGALYCLYMTIDGALYRLGLKRIGGYARWTSDPMQIAMTEATKLKATQLRAPDPDALRRVAAKYEARRTSFTQSKESQP